MPFTWTDIPQFYTFRNVFKQYFHHWFVSFKQEDGTEIFSKTEKKNHITANTSGTIHL